MSDGTVAPVEEDSAVRMLMDAAEWQNFEARKQDIIDQQEAVASRLERRAAKFMESNKKYRRGYQFPTLVGVTDDGCAFEVTNGIDYSDDFSTTLTWDQLA